MWPNTLVGIKQCNKIKPKLRQVRVSSAELVAYVSLPCESLATWLSILVLVLTLFTRETFKDISQHLVSLTILQLDSSIIDLLSDIVMIKLRTITLLLKLQANIHWCWHWFAASHPKSFQYSWCISRLTIHMLSITFLFSGGDTSSQTSLECSDSIFFFTASCQKYFLSLFTASAYEISEVPWCYHDSWPTLHICWVLFFDALIV